MRSRPIKQHVRFGAQLNALALAKSVNHGVPVSKRTRGSDRGRRGPFLPPEDWYETTDGDVSGYKIIVRPPGKGYRHIVTPRDIHQRLEQLPKHISLDALDVIQLSSMTRKKRSFPCYGMQWGSSVYLYPIEDSLIEYFDTPPKPAVFNEARMYGGRWRQTSCGGWKLTWTESTLRDFYLNNILIHELGHLLDGRNGGYHDREKYAEWFAIEHGYKPSERQRLARRAFRKKVRRRHHST